MAEVLAVVGMRVIGCHVVAWEWPSPPTLRRRACVTILGFLLAGCINAPLVPPADCTEVSDLFNIETVLADAEHPCRAWVEQTAGRVGRTPNASAAAWTLNTTAGTVVVVSAMHALDVGDFGAGGTDLPAGLLDPDSESPVTQVRWPAIDTSGLAAGRPVFPMVHPAIPASQHRDDFENLVPRHDYYVAVVGGPDRLALDPANPLEFDDPGAFLHASPSLGSVAAGDLILVVGFPRFGLGEASQAASVGRVLNDSEAEAAIIELAAAGDVEGDIPYEAEVELLFDGSAIGGMSGGGVFDTEGRLVGILVRASDPRDGKQVGRAVRMTFIAGELAHIYSAADSATRSAVAPYLEVDFP